MLRGVISLRCGEVRGEHACLEAVERLNHLDEHWTVTGKGLVVVGCPASIKELATKLQLPEDAPVKMTPTRSALALWGDLLDKYARVMAPAQH
jgi:hypothetical protein